MTLLDTERQILFFQGRKRFGWRAIDRARGRSYAEALAENPYSGFYRIRKQFGNVYHEVLPFYHCVNPRTPRQQAHRAVFRAGVEAYRTLTPDELKFWHKMGQKRKMSAYNAFISDYLLLHKI